MKKLAISFFLMIISFYLFGFKINSDITIRKITPGPLKYLCEFEYCPSHIAGTPSCYELTRRDLYFCSYRDFISDFNTIRDIEEVKGYFKNEDSYKVTNKINSQNFLKQADLMYRRINRRYFFISSHGSKYGDVFFSPYNSYTANEFPDMYNTKVALFSICYGGARSNAAEHVVKYKGVSNAIGWTQSITVSSARLFTTNFWKFLMEDEYEQSIEDVIWKTINHIYLHPSLDHPLEWRILRPVLYRAGKDPKFFYKPSPKKKNNRYLNGHKIVDNSLLFESQPTSYQYTDNPNTQVLLERIENIVEKSKIFNSYNLIFVESVLVKINNDYHLIYKYNCHFKGSAESIISYYLDTSTNELLDSETAFKLGI